MMTLIALAIGVAFVFSVAVTFGYPGMPLWEEFATFVTVMLLGLLSVPPRGAWRRAGG